MIGDTLAETWLRSRPFLPPRRRRTYPAVWACMGIIAAIEILFGAFAP